MKKRRLEPPTRLDEPEPAILPDNQCMNPWNGECRNTDIALFIYHEGRRVPICRRCWEKIASTSIEWSYN